jgi:hypothetical protein
MVAPTNLRQNIRQNRLCLLVTIQLLSKIKFRLGLPAPPVHYVIIIPSILPRRIIRHSFLDKVRIYNFYRLFQHIWRHIEISQLRQRPVMYLKGLQLILAL